MRIFAAIGVIAALLVPTLAIGTPDVPWTGVTTSVIPGDDGDFQAGVPFPTPRFTDNGDGTVRDNLTGLIWLRNANCSNGVILWDEALTWVSGVSDGDCGLSDSSVNGDWRLPTIREIVSLLNFNYNDPALSDAQGSGQGSEGDPFINVQGISGFYWSGTNAMGTADNGTHAHTANIARAITNIYDKDNPEDPDSPGVPVTTFAWPVKDCSSIGGGGCN